MARITDEVLVKIFKALWVFEWLPLVSAADILKAKAFRHLDANPKNVTSPGPGIYYSRLFLSRKVHALGRFSSAEAAARYTDVLLKFFWAYRYRSSTPAPPPSAYNFSASQVEVDYSNPKIYKLLVETEARLLQLGSITKPDSTEKKCRPPKYLTIKNVVAERLDKIEVKLDLALQCLNIIAGKLK